MNGSAFPYENLNITLMVCSTVLMLIIAILSFRLAGKKEDALEKKNMRTWGYFFLLLIFATLLTLTWRYLIPGDLALMLFGYELTVVNLVERTANAIVFIACFVRILEIEKSLIRLEWYKRHYFSAIVFVTIFINIFVDPNTLKEALSVTQLVFLAILGLGYMVFPMIYFYVARKSTGDIRTNAIKVFVGAGFIALGFLFRYHNLVGYLGMDPLLDGLIRYLAITAPISLILGTVFIFDGFRKA
ncbi:MAG: hypothetical protein HWN65_01725 [Candidatus Helarchaeota archaeon]|nr:hypothetical protein [Candidatus Helarchaeota archaeon]